MKKVLSIDLDYIMKPCIEIYTNLDYVDFCQNPMVRWDQFFEFSGMTSENLNIDVSNLMFCYFVFLKAIKESKSVSFGYDHDSILYSIEEYEDIHLINFDHHDDFLHGSFCNNDLNILKKTNKRRVTEYEQIIENNFVNEGNWIGWLNSKNKISEFIWVSNENSANKNRNSIIQSTCPNFKCITKEQVMFSSYEFDHVFVCLSPQYIPPQHWHYFSMFMLAYEEVTGQSSEEHWIKNKKFEFEKCYEKVTEQIKTKI